MLDHLRPPGRHDPTRAAAKEWLHVNVFDHRTGVVGLVNMSLHGDPDVEASRAVGVALLHVPGSGWVGNTQVGVARSAVTGVLALASRDVAVAVDPGRSGHVAARATLPGDGLDVQVDGVMSGDPLGPPWVVPFGSGYLGWTAYPRFTLTGRVRLGERTIGLDGAGGYADHNWGRWWWGDDAGWDWACWYGADGTVAVLSRTTDRAHRVAGPALLTVQHRGRTVRFTGDQVSVRATGRTRPSRRLPGAMAALHADRAYVRLPTRVQVRAGNGFDRFDLDFDVQDAAQLVLAEPARDGFGFLHESVGRFTCEGVVAGAPVRADGLGIAERAG